MFNKKQITKKRYEYQDVINRVEGKKKYFKTRKEAISHMSNVLEQFNLQVDYVVKTENKHSCEYVCTDNSSRFFIKRVYICK